MSEHAPKAVPPVTDPHMWASVYNALLFLEKDGELEWLRRVREVVQETERDRKAAR